MVTRTSEPVALEINAAVLWVSAILVAHRDAGAGHQIGPATLIGTRDGHGTVHQEPLLERAKALAYAQRETRAEAVGHDIDVVRGVTGRSRTQDAGHGASSPSSRRA